MFPKPTPRFTGRITSTEIQARWAEYLLVKLGGAFIPWTKLNGGT